MKIYIILTLIISLIMAVSPFTVLLFGNHNDYSQTDYKDESTIKVMRVSSGKVVDLNLFDYVIGSVSAEIPASFNEEAIKAQAVVCYTYALWLKNNADNSMLSGADITDSSETHQAYASETELRRKWGSSYESNMKIINECVSSVYGEFLQYNNEPIMAVYHAISPGYTENSGAVWGENIEYLKSVIANGDTLAADFDSSVEYTPSKFRELAFKLDKMILSENKKEWIGNAETDEVGFVKSIRIGCNSYNGNDIRRIFKLRSPYFTLKYDDGKFIFNVKGKGHGLGMSQNSADYMARQGSSYKEILLHFYAGAELVKG